MAARVPANEVLPPVRARRPAAGGLDTDSPASVARTAGRLEQRCHEHLPTSDTTDPHRLFPDASTRDGGGSPGDEHSNHGRQSMKRLAVISVLLGSAYCASAEAQATVTLYGIADGNFRVDHTNIGTLKGIGSGGYLASRWGIRGSEDLGNGLKANFIFEQGIDISDNSANQGNITPATPTTNTSSTGSRLFSRLATVGLSSVSFGNLRVGRDLKSIFVATITADAFRGSFVSQASNVGLKVNSRYDNGIFYDSPTFAGLRLSAQYALGESTTDTTPGTPKSAGNKGGAGLFYNAGPLYVTYAYSNDKAGTTSPLISNTVNHTRVNVVGVNYDFTVVKLHALAFSAKDNLGFNSRSGHVGVSVPFGAWTFIGGYGHINDMGSSNPATPQARTNYDANMYGAAATYSFSKRTLAYVAGAAWKSANRNGGSYGFIDANSPSQALYTPANIFGVNPWSAQIGINHIF